MNFFHLLAAIEFLACAACIGSLLEGGGNIYTQHIAIISGLACVLFLVAAEENKK